MKLMTAYLSCFQFLGLWFMSLHFRLVVFCLLLGTGRMAAYCLMFCISFWKVPGQATDLSGQLSQKDVTLPCNKTCFSRGPFVYGFIDLFTGSGESWQWGLGMEERAELNSSAHSHTLNVSKHHSEIQKKKIDQNVNVAVIQDTKQGPLLYPAAKLDTLEEESDDASKDTNLSRSLSEESSGDGTVDKPNGHKKSMIGDRTYGVGDGCIEEFILVEHLSETDDGDVDSEPSQLVSSDSVIHNHLSQTMERDLILAHLLRLACAPKGQLADALPEITSELHSLGIISERVRDLATKPSALFDKRFDQVVRQHMISSKVSQFWKTASDFEGQNSSSTPSSRYLNDFEELQPLVVNITSRDQLLNLGLQLPSSEQGMAKISVSCKGYVVRNLWPFILQEEVRKPNLE
ncbi:unnamed protein product [Ilex paraguariensis]|uniref:Uncharacterized protein n=1 Tax=Ilex paraguariensis TaxID=185542 RepID=A0ABC8UAH2_9AQUA